MATIFLSLLLLKLLSTTSVQLITQSCLALWDPLDCSMPGFPVHHQLLELVQTHVLQVGDAIQPSLLYVVVICLPHITTQLLLDYLDLYYPHLMEWGGRREEGSGWGTHVYLWRIHFDIWQN